jgi:preprotein translocase subunit SecF
MVLSIWALATWGLLLGIDFRGGTLLEVEYTADKVPSVEQVHTELAPLTLQSLTIQPTGEQGVIVRYLSSDEGANEQVLTKLKTLDDQLTLVRSDFIGASVSGQIRNNAIQALLVAMMAIMCYIAYAFRKVSRPISSWGYGIQAVIALIHDVLLTLGAFAFLGHFYHVEVNAPFIAALLTILGFSVHDTIVVYDRIRENLLRLRTRENFAKTVNRSLNETLARSLNTSFTVLFVLAALLVFGGQETQSFTLALFIGIASGAYSSFYIAAALLVTYQQWQRKRAS